MAKPKKKPQASACYRLQSTSRGAKRRERTLEKDAGLWTQKVAGGCYFCLFLYSRRRAPAGGGLSDLPFAAKPRI